MALALLSPLNSPLNCLSHIGTVGKRNNDFKSFVAWTDEYGINTRFFFERVLNGGWIVKVVYVKTYKVIVVREIV